MQESNFNHPCMKCLAQLPTSSERERLFRIPFPGRVCGLFPLLSARVQINTPGSSQGEQRRTKEKLAVQQSSAGSPPAVKTDINQHSQLAGGWISLPPPSLLLKQVARSGGSLISRHPHARCSAQGCQEFSFMRVGSNY